MGGRSHRNRRCRARGLLRSVPAKAVVGEVVPVRATVWREGHDAVAATLRACDTSAPTHPRLATGPGVLAPAPAVLIGEVMASRPAHQATGPAHVHRAHPRCSSTASSRPDSAGLWTYRVDGWGDPLATRRHAASTAKLGAGQSEAELANDLLIGARLLQRAATGVPPQTTRSIARGRRGAPHARRSLHGAPVQRFLDEVTELLDQYPLRELVTRGEQYGVRWTVRWPGSRAWYEMFPRSTGGRDKARTSGARDVRHRRRSTAPASPRMGFNIVYLPPIHPIGKVHRKGPTTAVIGGARRTSSVRCGHRERRRRPRRRPPGSWARSTTSMPSSRWPASRGMEVALDLALQCAPDHPWAQRIQSGSRRCRTAPSPTRRIRPRSTRTSIRSTSIKIPPGCTTRCCGWCDSGSRTAPRFFRVDNPHTKPPNFWVWLIGEVKNEDPDVLFLSEAFTRPDRLYGLAKRGFTQSYTYFTWRTSEVGDHRIRPTRSPTTPTRRTAQPLGQHFGHPARESLQMGGPGYVRDPRGVGRHHEPVVGHVLRASNCSNTGLSGRAARSI